MTLTVEKNFSQNNNDHRNFGPRGNHQQRSQNCRQNSKIFNRIGAPENPIGKTVSENSTTHSRVIVIAIFVSNLVIQPLIDGSVSHST